MEIEKRVAMKKVLFDIEVERHEQHQKWGEQNHPSFPFKDPSGTYGKKQEAVRIANSARKSCQDAFASGNGSYAHIATEEYMEAMAEFDDPSALRVELVQTAAVLVAWIEKLDREAANGTSAE